MTLRHDFMCNRMVLKISKLRDLILLKNAGNVETQAMMMAVFISTILDLLGLSLSAEKCDGIERDYLNGLRPNVYE